MGGLGMSVGSNGSMGGFSLNSIPATTGTNGGAPGLMGYQNMDVLSSLTAMPGVTGVGVGVGLGQVPGLPPHQGNAFM